MVQVDVPLQVLEAWHGLFGGTVHVIGVPEHWPVALHLSL
jgi:hypothetical protein